MSIIITSPHGMAEIIAKKVQSKRLALNLSQQTLAEHSGVSYGVLKKFERTGLISLESLLKLAMTLGCLEEFRNLFPAQRPNQYITIDKLMKDKPRKRGRQ